MISTLKNILLRREAGLLALIVVSTVIVSIIDFGFLSWTNWKDILVRASPTLIVSCGVMLVILTGEIDISTGSLMALLSAILGILLSSDHLNWNTWAGAFGVIAVSGFIGCITGLLVTIGRVPSIIVTLGWLTAFRGLTIFIMKGENIGNLPNDLLQLTKYGWVGIPLSIWTAVLVVLLTWLILNFSPLGWQIRATGSSSYSASMKGITSNKVKIIAFTFTGLMTGLATIVEVPRLPRIESGIGVGFELLVVTCVVVGGVSITGGKGKIRGVVLAVILMTMIRPLLTFLNLGESGEMWTKAIQGLFILTAVMLDQLAHKITLSNRKYRKESI